MIGLPGCFLRSPAKTEKEDECPRIELASDSVDFDETRAGEVGSASLLVSNDCSGATDLEIALSFDDAQFTATSASATVAPGAVQTLDLRWAPDDFAPDEGTLILTSNDPTNATVFVTLTGTPVPDADGDGYDAVDDCDEGDASVSPAADELWYDGLDQDCDGASDYDADVDGYDSAAWGGEDCDDGDPATNPGATEVWYDGLDQDCDGWSDDDADHDGHDVDLAGGDDCDDGDDGVYPGAAELWYDGIDADCDGASDHDADADGHDADFAGGDDCDDADADINPDAAEAWYDGVDRDCDGADDYDADTDGYADPRGGGADCDDSDASIHPGATETWYDGVDSDCDGASDDDADADGFDASSAGGADCDDSDADINPDADETWYDGVDADCDGASDDDADGDGFDAEAAGGADCDDDDASVNPDATETWYDGVDSDCDDASDDDADGDGEDAYPTGDDCADDDASTTEGEPEVLNGLDDDCDGSVDEGLVVAGDVILSEFMANPAAVSDVYGEWFELYNASAVDVDLYGWTVYSDDGGAFVIDQSVPIPAGGYAVLGCEDDLSLNGGVTLDYTYSRADFSFADTADSLYLLAGTVAVFDLTWSSSWSVTSGYAHGLDVTKLTLAGAATRTNWCTARTALSGGDYGTPGEENDWCLSLDHDGDGESQNSGDCDDADDGVYSTNPEVLGDGLDQDCDNVIDELDPDTTLPYVTGPTTSAYLHAVTSGDLDDDGVEDLVLGVNTYGSALGTFWALSGSDYTTWAGPVASYADITYTTKYYSGDTYTLAVAEDISGDGIDDLIVAGKYTSGDGSFRVFEGPVSGTVSATSYDSEIIDYDGRGVGWLTTADMDADGALEIVASDPSSDANSTYYGGIVMVFDGASLPASGSASLADLRILSTSGSSSTSTGTVGRAVAVGDVNADGYDDLLITNSAAYAWLVLGDGFATSGAQVANSIAEATIYLSPSYTDVPVLSDADGDGDLDLLLGWGSARYFADAGSLSGSITIADQDAIYDPVSSAASARTCGVTLDTDNDGHRELGYMTTVTSGADRTAAFFGPDAFAALDLSTPTTVGFRVYECDNDIVSTDLDGDGDEEVAIGIGNENLGMAGQGAVYLWEP